MADYGKAFPSKYLACGDLNGGSYNVTIARVELEEVGEQKEEKWVAYFTKGAKGVVLNKTRCEFLETISGSRDTDDWVNLTVCIFPSTATFKGKTVPALGFKAAVAAAKKKPVPAPVVADPEPDFGDSLATDLDTPF